METILLEKTHSEIAQGHPVALVTVTKVEGSTPATVGALMVVPADGEPLGTVGGGRLEAEAIDLAKKCMRTGESRSYFFPLESLPMICGGAVEIFIRVFAPRHKLLIVGEGHIALEVYRLGHQLGMHTVIVGDRSEYANRERFPLANEILVGAIDEMLATYPIDRHTYIVIVTRGHRPDELALRTVIEREAGYVGMIGSRNKSRQVLQNLAQAGVAAEAIERVYTPIGLNLGGDSPAEIAFSIMAEILLIKNQGSLAHMRDIKK